jgi:hypothetical protein
METHISTQINPNIFNVHADTLKDKIFLYSQRKPKKTSIIRFRDKKYKIIKSFAINLVGSITDPKRSIRSIVSACYKKHLFLLSPYDASLFVYNGHEPREEKILSIDAPVTLNFKVYLLKEI